MPWTIWQELVARLCVINRCFVCAICFRRGRKRLHPPLQANDLTREESQLTSHFDVGYWDSMLKGDNNTFSELGKAIAAEGTPSAAASTVASSVRP